MKARLVTHSDAWSITRPLEAFGVAVTSKDWVMYGERERKNNSFIFKYHSSTVWNVKKNWIWSVYFENGLVV